MNGQNLNKFCIHIIIDKINIGIVNRHFRKFVTELRQDLSWDCKASFFANLQQSLELWPLIYVRIWFLLNILRMNGQNLTKFCIHIIIDKIYIGIVKHYFLEMCNRVMALDLCQNLVFATYLENEWTEFKQILYTHCH